MKTPQFTLPETRNLKALTTSLLKRHAKGKDLAKPAPVPDDGRSVKNLFYLNDLLDEMLGGGNLAVPHSRYRAMKIYIDTAEREANVSGIPGLEDEIRPLRDEIVVTYQTAADRAEG